MIAPPSSPSEPYAPLGNTFDFELERSREYRFRPDPHARPHLRGVRIGGLEHSSEASTVSTSGSKSGMTAGMARRLRRPFTRAVSPVGSRPKPSRSRSVRFFPFPALSTLVRASCHAPSRVYPSPSAAAHRASPPGIPLRFIPARAAALRELSMPIVSGPPEYSGKELGRSRSPLAIRAGSKGLRLSGGGGCPGIARHEILGSGVERHPARPSAGCVLGTRLLRRIGQTPREKKPPPTPWSRRGEGFSAARRLPTDDGPLRSEASAHPPQAVLAGDPIPPPPLCLSHRTPPSARCSVGSSGPGWRGSLTSLRPPCGSSRPAPSSSAGR